MNHKILRYATVVLCINSFFTPRFTSAQKSAAQSPAGTGFKLDVDSIMRGPRLVGYPPTNVYWSQDSQRVYFRWKQPDEPRLKEPSLYVVNRDGSNLKQLSEDEARQAPPASGELSKDKSMTVFTEDGDLVIYDHSKQTRRQLTRTTDVESNPHFTRDSKHVYFTRSNNLYLLTLDTGELVQLTDIRAAVNPLPTANARGAAAAGRGAAVDDSDAETRRGNR